MDIKALRPRLFSADHESGDSKRQWIHWHKSFTTYLAQMEDVSEANTFNLLVNHIDAAVYELIAEATSYENAITILSTTYARTPSPIFARYSLMSCKQQAGESLDIYFQKSKWLSVDCNYQTVSAQVYKEEAIRDAFIGGMMSNNIRQHLLIDHTLTHQTAFDKARSLAIALKNAEMYNSNASQSNPFALHIAKIQAEKSDIASNKLNPPGFSGEYSAAVTEKCMFCRNKRYALGMCRLIGIGIGIGKYRQFWGESASVKYGRYLPIL